MKNPHCKYVRRYVCTYVQPYVCSGVNNLPQGAVEGVVVETESHVLMGGGGGNNSNLTLCKHLQWQQRQHSTVQAAMTQQQSSFKVTQTHLALFQSLTLEETGGDGRRGEERGGRRGEERVWEERVWEERGREGMGGEGREEGRGKYNRNWGNREWKERDRLDSHPQGKSASLVHMHVHTHAYMYVCMYVTHTQPHLEVSHRCRWAHRHCPRHAEQWAGPHLQSGSITVYGTVCTYVRMYILHTLC